MERRSGRSGKISSSISSGVRDSSGVLKKGMRSMTCGVSFTSFSNAFRGNVTLAIFFCS